MNRRLRRITRGLLFLVASALVFACTSCAFADGEKHSPQRAEFEAIARELETSGEPQFFPDQFIPLLEQQLQSPRISMREFVNFSARLAMIHLQTGAIDRAEAVTNDLFRRIEQLPGDVEPPYAVYLLRALVHLRRAEVENCINRHNAACCIFPLRGDAVHTEKAPARIARENYLHALRLQPDHLGARWLLNLTSMAIGDYPGAVPEALLIPPAAFESTGEFDSFIDIAPQLGIDAFNGCGGAIAEDFNRDGLLDIVTSTIDIRGPLRYYENVGPDGFVDRSESSRSNDQLGGLNCIGADYDNDGDTDVFVLRGAWWRDSGRIRNSLLRNDVDPEIPNSVRFTDVTHEAGLADPAAPTQAAVWGDFDNDGLLDLFVGNEDRSEFPDDAASYPSQLFRNNGDGTFIDIAREVGVTNDRFCKGVTAGDYDDDGDLDLYVSNINHNRLYRNNFERGALTFTDVAPELGLISPDERSFACWFFDFNNDGALDLFVTGYDATIEQIAADALGLPWEASIPCLYRNNGDGTFTDVAAAMGLAHPYRPMGANFGDLDNDGWLDIYLTTGEPDLTALMPNVMLRNDRGERFLDITTAGGFGHLQKGHGVAFADFDNDGDQDIYHQLGGFYPGDSFHNALFLNPTHPRNGKHFITIRLIGTKTNRMAVGARIRIMIETPDGKRTIHRAAGSVSSFGGSPSRQEIGLADAVRIRRIEIDWPTSRSTQTFEDVPLDSFLEITEDAAAYRTIDPVHFDLGDVASRSDD